MDIKELNDKLTTIGNEWRDNLDRDMLVIVADNGTKDGAHVITVNASPNDEFTTALTMINHAFKRIPTKDVELTKTAVVMAVAELMKHVADK